MDRETDYKRLPGRFFGGRCFLLLSIFLFAVVSAASIVIYIRKLDTVFLKNIQFYMSEIADHDKKSVDNEIGRQWEKLGVVANKLGAESFQCIEEAQIFLNLEMSATGFEKLMLLDDRGNSYQANYLIMDASKTEWARKIFVYREPFVLLNSSTSNFAVRNNSLFYGIPMEPVVVEGVTFVGIVGSYKMGTVRDSMQVQFLEGNGLARVIGRDGTVITSETPLWGEPLDNLLEELSGSRVQAGPSLSQIGDKLAAGQPFEAVYTKDGADTILSAKPLDNADWMMVVTLPRTVAAGQTAIFLKNTAILLIFLAAVVGGVLLFAFVSYKRTLILKNSREIFYRERLFNLLALHTDDVFIIVDAKTEELNFISENAQRTLGIKPCAEGMADLAVLPDEVKKSVEMEVQTLLTAKAGEHGRVEFEFDWVMPGSCEKKWIHVAIYSAVPEFYDQLSSCLIIVMSDYTQVRAASKKLEAAKEQAQEAARSKSIFLSNMSHEMRTPLNGIIGCIELIKSHLEEPEALREYLKKAEATARYLISLVSDILDMSKIESHKLTLESRALSYREICRNIETMFQSQMEEKEIHFQTELEEPLWVVEGDGVRIQQVLTNLLGNALKFTDAWGRVALNVRQRAVGEEMVETVIKVSDTGVGMSEAFLKRIWTPYEQERLDNARLHGGTGLGLAITHELVRLMGGEITVESALGKGSVFSVKLRQQRVRPEGGGEPPKDRDPGYNGRLDGKTILIAEDNELNMEILTALLEERGVKVLKAVNGEDAVRTFDGSKLWEVDAVLMDMQMPVMDGCAATGEIRKLDRADAGRLIVIACTANAFKEDIKRALDAGMNGHIAKPLDIDKLEELLIEFWKEERHEI